MPLKAHENLHWEDSRAEKAIEDGGSKAGTYRFLEANCPEVRPHLPEGTAYLAPGEDIDAFLAKLKFRDRPKIVRGCHPLDFTGMVDVINSDPRIKNIEDVRTAIMNLFEDSKSPEVTDFMRYESGDAYDDNVGVLVQDYYGRHRGSIIEHPHERGIYRIEEVTPEGFGSIVDWGHFNEDGKKTVSYNHDIPRATEIIGLYRKVLASGLVPSMHSFQMEFGFDAEERKPIKFYQARLFRKFEPAISDFEPDRYQTHSPKYFAFGLTPPEGTSMTIAELDLEEIEKNKNSEKMAYLNDQNGFSTRNWHSRELNLMPRNMGIYVPMNFGLLEHGHYRWIQKSPLTVWASHYDDCKKKIIDKGSETPIQFYSNGIQSFIDFPEDKKRQSKKKSKPKSKKK